jgi:hypothetical protein
MIMKGCSRCKFYIIFPCRRGRDQLTMHRVHITPYVVSSNPAHGEIYSIQHNVIKFVSDLRQVGEILLFPSLKNLTVII